MIYNNEIMDVCKEGSDLFVYANDAKLFSHINSAKDVESSLTDLISVDSLIKEWSLKLNIDYDYFIGKDIIGRAELINDLGVVFDQHLKFGLIIRE